MPTVTPPRSRSSQSSSGRPAGRKGAGRSGAARRPGLFRRRGSKPQGPPDPRRRMAWLVVASLAALLLLAGRLVAIQGMDTMRLAQEALDSRLVSKPLPAARGVITAADGTVLADNAMRYRVVVDQQNIARYENADGELVGAWGAAQAMAGPLDTDPGLLLPELAGDKLWNPVAEGLTSEVWNEIDALDIPGVSMEEYSIRTYPVSYTHLTLPTKA